MISYFESIMLNDPYNFLTSWPRWRRVFYFIIILHTVGIIALMFCQPLTTTTIIIIIIVIAINITIDISSSSSFSFSGCWHHCQHVLPAFGLKSFQAVKVSSPGSDNHTADENDCQLDDQNCNCQDEGHPLAGLHSTITVTFLISRLTGGTRLLLFYECLPEKTATFCPNQAT